MPPPAHRGLRPRQLLDRHLQLAHSRTPARTVDPSPSAELPDAAQPDRTIAFRDDSVVSRRRLERLPVSAGGPRYEVEPEWYARS